jgi:hypothetical protein
MAPFILLFAALVAQPGGDDAGLVALEQYQWTYRLIIIFASAPNDPRYVEQQASFDRLKENELIERDLLVFSCFPSGGTLEPYAQVPEQRAFGVAAANDLRSTFHVQSEEFQVVLVGKDGGEKRRSSIPVAAKDFLVQIDSMPMRQQEMREQED